MCVFVGMITDQSVCAFTALSINLFVLVHVCSELMFDTSSMIRTINFKLIKTFGMVSILHLQEVAVHIQSLLNFYIFYNFKKSYDFVDNYIETVKWMPVIKYFWCLTF